MKEIKKFNVLEKKIVIYCKKVKPILSLDELR